MIRPVTLVCWILALSAGLYLYRAKHEVELMDQHIDQIAKQTAELRAESRGLLDEWIRLGEPEQLHRYSDEYLGLQPISPGQFARQSDLAARLPAVQPDPPPVQADIAAMSSGEVAVPEIQSSSNQSETASGEATEAAIANLDRKAGGGADDIPVPPIPPAIVPPVVSAASAAPALPLQARPVTPRVADGQAGPETPRPRVNGSPPTTDEPHVVAARVTPPAPVEPNRSSPVTPTGQGSAQPAAQTHGPTPVQVQGQRDVAGAPPLQAQGPSRDIAQGPGRAPALPRAADNHVNEPVRESHPPEPQHTAGAGAPYVHQGPAETQQAQSGQSPTAPVQAGSLLGMSRSSVPLPLPAPTPVNANWSGPAGTGAPGSGR